MERLVIWYRQLGILYLGFLHSLEYIMEINRNTKEYKEYKGVNWKEMKCS